MGRFDGRVAVVTGAASGLGRATAASLVADGAIVACLDVDGAAVKEAASEMGEAALPIACDVSDAAAVNAAVAEAAETLGRVSVVCNVAGIGRFQRTEDMPVEDWDRILAVNLTGTFLVCRATIPHLLDGGGSVVNVASSSGMSGVPYQVAYCASKAGVINLTRSLALEYLRRGIRFNCVTPGMMDTPLINSFSQMPEGVELKELRKVMTPLGTATPDEVARVVTFVASDEAPYMTGAVVPVDGGITA